MKYLFVPLLFSLCTLQAADCPDTITIDYYATKRERKAGIETAHLTVPIDPDTTTLLQLQTTLRHRTDSFGHLMLRTAQIDAFPANLTHRPLREVIRNNFNNNPSYFEGWLYFVDPTTGYSDLQGHHVINMTC